MKVQKINGATFLNFINEKIENKSFINTLKDIEDNF